MKKTYCNLMDGLQMSDRGIQAFYEKLDHTKKRPAVLRIALIAACLCLCLTGIAYGAKLITGLSITKLITDGKVFDQPIAGDEVFEKFTHGYSVDFPDIQAYPLSAFSEAVQNTTENTILRFNTLEQVEEHLGITFCENTTLKAYPPRVKIDTINGGKKSSRYTVSVFASEGLPNGAIWYTSYNMQGIYVDISARLAIQHPSIPKEDVPLYLKQFRMLEEKEVVDLYQEQYTTPNGLSVTIVTMAMDTRAGSIDHIAHFALDNITYSITVSATEQTTEKAMETLKSILDGYVIQ